MGLDMWLERVDFEDGKENLVEVAYWRKANAIHAWFVNNVQDGVDDCGAYKVCKPKLRELYEAVCLVMDDPNKAAELLPTSSGSFFGDTEYGVWYRNHLKTTRLALEQIFADDDEYCVYQYTSSW